MLVAGLVFAPLAIAAVPAPAGARAPAGVDESAGPHDAGALDIQRVGHPGGSAAVRIAGVPITCTASNGVPVIWVVTQPGGPVGRLPGGAGVTSDAGPNPHIFIRADLFGALPAKLQLYAALHECAHFHLPPGQNTELNADCFAARTGAANGWFTAQDFDWLRKALAEHPWGHPGGPIHAANLDTCLRPR